MESNGINLGTRVSWRSQANGNWSTKEGLLIYKCPSARKYGARLDVALGEENAWLSGAWLEEIRTSSNNRRRFGTVGEYIVAVDRRIKSDGTVDVFKTPKFYSPRMKLESSVVDHKTV